MDKLLKSEVRQLLHWFKSTDMSPKQQLQIFFFLGVSSTAAKLKSTWLGSAPAHPEALRTWLQSKLETAAGRIWDGEFNRFSDLNLASLARLVGPIVAVSQPDDWLSVASKFVPGWRVRLTGDAEKLLVANRELAGFLSATSSSAVNSLQIVAAPRRTKALAAQRLKWAWPLTIAVADEDNDLRFALQKVAPTAAYQFKPFNRQTSASILFVSGNIDEAARRLDVFGPDRFAYIVVTGVADNVTDLISLARKHNAAGVIALGYGAEDGPIRTYSLDRLFTSLEEGATLDDAVHTEQMTRPVIFGESQALQQTTILYDLNGLMSSVSTKAEDVQFRVGIGCTSLGIQVGAYKPRDLLARLESRPRILNRDDFASLITLLGEIRGQLHEHPDRSLRDFPGLNRADSIETVIGRDTAGNLKNYDADEDAYGSTTLNPPYTATVRSDDRGDLPPITNDTAKSARVQAVLLADGRQVNSLRPDQEAAVQIWISPFLSDSVVYANRAFPLDKLGSEGYHELQLAFIPLKGTPNRGKPQLQSSTFVMSTGELPPVNFKIVTGSDSDEYRARLLVIHRNRVVQSILFTVVISEIALTEPHLQLIVENDVKPDLSYLRNGSAFDLSLVLNHNDEDQAGVIAVRPNRVSFREPEGNFKTSMDSIRTILWSLNSAWDPYEEHDPEHLEDQLRDLARHGNILRDALFGAEPDLEVFTAPIVYKPDHPLRLQVVEAKAGSYLPVEFFYDFRSPRPDARLCAKYRLGDFPNATCTGCQDRGSRDVICPIGFWGVSRVIERRPKDAYLPMGANYECSEPLGERQRLVLTAQALLGSSEKVLPADQTEISEILTRRGKAPLQAECWTTWEGHIQANGPSLLVAVAHTDVVSKILTLEIRKSQLLVCDIESELVRRQVEENPVVILLGCQTKFADEPLQSAAARFKQKGAALVISTVATMRGAQAPACMAALIEEIDKASAMSAHQRRKGMATAGMVILRAKQKLLGSGHAIGMCLTANGDAEWHF
jgi:hypothetical protein